MPQKSLTLRFIPLLLFGLLFSLTTSTIITFYIDHQISQPLDYVQISAIIKTNSVSLQTSILDATNIIKDIENTVMIYCHTYAKDKNQCRNIINASSFSIKPQYQIEKKRPIFSGFVVAHQISIKVKESNIFGQLIDDILKKGVDRINSLQWKPLKQIDGEQVAVQQGIIEANKICSKIGMKLIKIIKVQQVTDFGEEQEQQPKQGENDGKDEAQKPKKPLDINDDIIYYKFVIQCNKKQK